MIETQLKDFNTAIKLEGMSANLYFTDESIASYLGRSSKSPAEESSRPKNPKLTQVILLQMKNGREKKTIMVEFLGSQIRVFGMPQKAGLSQYYKTNGLKCLFESDPGLGLNRTTWEAECIFIAPTLNELAIHGALQMILTSATPNELCTVQTKNANGQNIYLPDYCSLFSKG